MKEMGNQSCIKTKLPFSLTLIDNYVDEIRRPYTERNRL